ncbi:MAG TPA: glycosyltransferase [Baekduia sp.]|nr:glycosyltransferase [Baekduia sp.]
MTPQISLVLPVRDDVELTLRCLEGIAREPEEVPFEVVIVDDASQDATPDLLAGLDGDVRVLRNDAPRGFGAAADQGAAAAEGEHVVVLQQDAVPCAGWLRAMSRALEGPHRPVAVLPRSARPDGQWLPDAHWLALGVRRSAYAGVGGFAGAARPGRAEKASLVEALRGRGHVVDGSPDAVFLATPRDVPNG